jgi:iron complex outermembrane recepter protein
VSNVGVFAQAGASPLERLSLLAGLRWDRTRFAVDDRFRTSDPDDSGDRVLSAVSPSLGATLRVTSTVNVYVNVATAFETPTTTELANRPSGAGGFNPDLEPQRVRSFEAGTKGALGRRGSYQLSAYHARIRDALIPFEVAGAAGRQFFRNAGRARHRGVELGVSLAPMRRVRADLGYTLTDARFDEYTVGTAVYDGNDVPGIARHRAELALTYERGDAWYAGVDVRGMSRMWADDANTASSPGYWVTGVRVGTRALRAGRVGASLFAGLENALDARYNSSVVINAFGRRYYEPGAALGAHVGGELRLLPR